MEDNKCEELRKQIEDKKGTDWNLTERYPETRSRYKTLFRKKKIGNILEKATALLNKYYFWYDSFFNEFYFCYCKNISESRNGIGIEYKRIEIGKTNNIGLSETSSTTISFIEYFDKLFILNEEQAKEICNKINKIVCGEESVKDLFGYLKDLYIANKETLWEKLNI